MHAIERPLLSRTALLALGAVLLAIVVLLLAASRLGDTGLSAGTASTGAPASPPATAPRTALVASSWFANPFVVPVHAVRFTAATRR
jgi:hypothetical protein